jgi:hypothetical protein
MSGTVVHGAVWLRICVQNLHTHAEHVEDLVDTILEVARRLAQAPVTRMESLAAGWHGK